MIDFSLYPNLNGNLGENKVQIPDGVTTFWPDGDALVRNFIYKNGKLSGIVDTKALIANDAKSTTIPYDFVKSKFENVREDSVKFNLGERCKYFTLKLMPKYKGCKGVDAIKTIDANYLENDIDNGVWSKDLEDLENGKRLFGSSSNLIVFESNLKKLQSGFRMFTDCINLVSVKSNLSSLTNGAGMFWNCSNLNEITNIDGEPVILHSLQNGEAMFYMCESLKKFETPLSSLSNGNSMFSGCSQLESFTSDLSSLTNGNGMFSGCSNILDFKCNNLNFLNVGSVMFSRCSNLKTFDYNLSSLTNGNSMFYLCTNLTSFTSDLSSLTNGEKMFYGCTNISEFKCNNLNSLSNGYDMFYGCKNLTTFKWDLSQLTNGRRMFANCYNLSSFDSDLKSITEGYEMFANCNGLISFKSNLKSLTSGSLMFAGCKLDTQSIKNIANTINTVTESNLIHIGIGNKTPSEEENTYLTQIHNKGWQVYVNGSGNAYAPTDGTSLIPIDGEQNLNPIPFWAKPVPATEDEANYIDENGNYYNILGGQFIYVNDPETYGMFINEEDAAQNMRLTKIEKDI